MVKNRSSKSRRGSSKGNGGRKNPTIWMLISPNSCDENRQQHSTEPTGNEYRVCKARSPDPEGGLRKVRGELGYVARDEHRQLLDQLSRKTP